MIEPNLEKTQKIHGNIIASTKIESGKNYELNGLEFFGGINFKLNDFYQGNCDLNDLKDELELMIIIANRMMKIPKVLMDYIRKLNAIIDPCHWNEKIEEKYTNVRLTFNNINA